MTVYLHVGIHKTGTTTTQRFAQANAALLRQRGLFYPGYDLIGRKPNEAHHHFCHAVAGDVDPHRFHSPEDVTAFVEAIAAARRPHENVLLSAESIYRHTLGEDGDIWAAKERYVRKLAGVLEPLGPITVVMCLRRQDSFALSQYQEDIKVTRAIYEFEQFLRRRESQFAYLRHFLMYEEIFGRVKLIVYEDLIQGRGLITNFFAALDVPLTEREANFPYSNAALHPAVVEYKRRLNASEAPLEEVKRVAKVLPAVSAALYGRERACLASDGTLADFLARFERENRILAKIARGHSTVPLFPERAPLPFATLGGPEEEARIAAEIGRQLAPDALTQGEEAGDQRAA